VQKVGYLLSPPTRRFFGDFGSFVLPVIICALQWGIYCPLQLAPPTRQFFGDFRKFCFAHNYLCPSFQGIYCPLQLAPPTRQFFGDLAKFCFVRNYLCPPICGVTCVLHAALAACFCCSILSISRMMCGVRNSLRMFW
jgi:hypothetical protein